MASYAKHNKIAEMAGIPSAISEDINRFIEDINPPREFENHNTERKIFVCGHLNVSIRTMMGNEKLHDRRKEWIQKEDLKWLLATRKEYIKCYYLHLAVDDIYEYRNRIRGGRETIENCINDWEKNQAIIIPGTEPYLKDVIGFLRSNIENIRPILTDSGGR